MTNRHRRRNPARRRSTYRRRQHRRNPVRTGQVAIFHPKTWAPFVGTGALAAMATTMAPRLLFGPSATPVQAYLTQGAVAVAGSFLLPVVGLRNAHPMVWFIVSGSTILADWVGRYVAQFLGLSAYPDGGLGAYPYRQDRRGVTSRYYPPRMSGNVGVYPYQYGMYGMDAYEQAPGVPSAPYEYAYGR